MRCDPSDDLISTLEAGEVPSGDQIGGGGFPGTRRVIVPESDQGCVVKFRYDEDPRVDQVRGERITWSRHGCEMSDVFAAVRESDEEWLVMDRYPENPSESEITETKRKIWNRGWACVDAHDSNFGRDGEEVRMIDFESCSPRETMEDWQIEQFESSL